MKTGSSVEELTKFKDEATIIMEEEKFSVPKWESNVESLESMNTRNPKKILGMKWCEQDNELEITEEISIRSKYVLTEKNFADVGSQGAMMNQMENRNWYDGPPGLLNARKWPEQPILSSSTSVTNEEKPIKELFSCIL